jgi:hypothetical protein
MKDDATVTRDDAELLAAFGEAFSQARTEADEWAAAQPLAPPPVWPPRPFLARPGGPPLNGVLVKMDRRGRFVFRPGDHKGGPGKWFSKMPLQVWLEDNQKRHAAMLYRKLILPHLGRSGGYEAQNEYVTVLCAVRNNPQIPKHRRVKEVLKRLPLNTKLTKCLSGIDSRKVT